MNNNKYIYAITLKILINIKVKCYDNYRIYYIITVFYDIEKMIIFKNLGIQKNRNKIYNIL